MLVGALKVDCRGKSIWTYDSGANQEVGNPKDVFEEAQGAKVGFFSSVDSSDKFASSAWRKLNMAGFAS